MNHLNDACNYTTFTFSGNYFKKEEGPMIYEYVVAKKILEEDENYSSLDGPYLIQARDQNEAKTLAAIREQITENALRSGTVQIFTRKF